MSFGDTIRSARVRARAALGARPSDNARRPRALASRTAREQVPRSEQRGALLRTTTIHRAHRAHGDDTMSLALSGHGHCIQCQRYATERRKASVRRCAKHARSKLARRAALDEIAEGEWAREDEQRELAARLYGLRIAALDEGCDGPECSCHARRAAAIEELTALTERTETP